MHSGIVLRLVILSSLFTLNSCIFLMLFQFLIFGVGNYFVTIPRLQFVTPKHGEYSGRCYQCDQHYPKNYAPFINSSLK